MVRAKNKKTFLISTFFFTFLPLTGCATLLMGGCGSSNSSGTPASTPITVTIQPELSTLTDGQTLRFTATVKGDTSNEGVLWTADGGSIDLNGHFKAPESITSAELISVKATSVSDPTIHATAKVLLGPQGALSLTGEELRDPQQIVVEPGGTTALVTEREPGELSRIDLVSGNVTMILSGLNRPNGLQISSDGKTAWVVEQTSPTSSIVKINLLDPSDITRISISLNNPTGLAIETDEKTALVTSFSVVGRLAQADLSTGTLTTKVENLLFPTGVVIEDPGKKALITGKTSGKLYRVNLEVNLEDCSRPTSTCSEVMAGFGEPSSPVLSKDRNSVYLLQCKIIDNPLLCVDKFLTKVIVAGPQAPTTSTLTPLGITQPQWFALEPGEHTALITDANPDGIRRVKRN